MDEGEFIVFVVSGVLAAVFLMKWYKPIVLSWPAERGIAAKIVLGNLPVAALCIIVPTLLTMAASDVVNDPIFIVFYVALGVAWLYLGTFIMGIFFDLSWRDDILNLNNTAALFAFAGGFLGLAIIYAGANAGDGPGWWCVLEAGGLGLMAWVAVAVVVNLLTRVSERITVGRDVACGVRFGCFLLASGIILGWAASGDWTSSYMTVVEFGVGWPVLPLAAVAVMGEWAFKK